MQAWRITKPDRISIDGEESRAEGGRWHRPGRPLVYAASSCSLAVLEFLVHLEGEPDGLRALQIFIPEDLRRDSVDTSLLPPDWRRPDHESCCRSGEEWLARPFEERGAVLMVPSAVVPLELNIVIDPMHPDSERIDITKVHDFALDARLLE